MKGKIIFLLLLPILMAVLSNALPQYGSPVYNENYPQYDPRDPVRELPYGQDGSILVRNGGLYSAIFYVDYTLLGRKVRKESGYFGLGASKSIQIPNQSTDITCSVKAKTFFSGDSTIFTEEHKYPVRRCYKIGGTTLGQTYEEGGC